MEAVDAQPIGGSRRCSEPTRDALERLQREGNWEALVRSLHGSVPRAEAEDLVSRSFERALSGLCNAEHVAGVHAWIAQDVRYALSHHRQHQRVVQRALQVQGNALPRPGDEDLAETQVVRKGNAELAADLLADFSKRDQRILHLAWGEGEKRPGVASKLGVSERIVKRTLFKGAPRLEGALVERLGGGCGEQGEQLVRDVVFNRAGKAERAQAKLHMRGCEACRDLHGRLHEVRVGVAALAPLPLAAGGGALKRGQAQLEHAFDWAREQVVRLHARAVDLTVAPNPLPRPGAVLANFGVCVAAAGGTYCVAELPPLNKIDEPAAKVAEQRPAERPEPPAPQLEPAAPAPQTTEPPPAPVVPEPDPSKRPADGAQEPQAPPPVAEPALQFPETSGSAPQSAPRSPQPAPEPSGAPAPDGPEFP